MPNFEKRDEVTKKNWLGNLVDFIYRVNTRLEKIAKLVPNLYQSREKWTISS